MGEFAATEESTGLVDASVGIDNADRGVRIEGTARVSRNEEYGRVLAVAEHWGRRCLIEERSLFTGGSLWNQENFKELHGLYVENLDDDSKDTFLVKLERQLEPGSPDAKCLWAEMTWVYRLIERPESMRVATKREQICRIWGWSGRDLAEGHELLSDAVLGAGVATPGTAYNTHSWREFRFFVDSMQAWFSLDLGERESLLGEPWRFASWLDKGKYADKRMFRHAVLFLLFPDSFEPIVSNQNKATIVRRLHEGDRPDTKDAVAVDRALLAIRERLEREHPNFRFYRSPIRELWQDAASPGDSVAPVVIHDSNGEPPSVATYTVEDAHRGMFIPRLGFDCLIESIRSRRNLVLQGPPGTGKTFLARRIAWCVIGRKDNDPIEMVQFFPDDGIDPSQRWYERVVDTQVAPLLREYWFDAPKDVDAEVARLKGNG